MNTRIQLNIGIIKFGERKIDMSKNVIINQDKLVVLKEALDEFMVDKNSKVADHDYVWFILYRGDLLFFDEKNKNLLDDFFHRHQDELGDFVYSYENTKYKARMNFDGFVDFLGSSIPYLITGYVSRGNEVYINKNENYDVLNSNELFQFVKDMPNSKFYFDGKELDRNDILHNKGKKMPTVWYHGTTFEYALDILGNGLRAKPEKSLYKIKHDKTVFMSSNFRQAKWYAEYKSRRSYGSWTNKPCVLKIDGSKIDNNKIVYDYDVYNAHAIDRNDSVYNDRMGELGLTYDRISQTITKPTDPRKYMKVGYRGIIMPNTITSVYLVSYNGDTEMTPTDFVKYINDTYVGFDEDDMKLLNMNEAAPEVDEYEIGAESDNPPVGGNGYHINESASFDSSEIGGVNYSWDFDEDEYKEWLEEAEYENTQESLMEYINDNVEFELEYLDNETYHTCGTDYVDYDTLEDMFGSKMQNEILTTCMNDGSGSFETVNLYSDDDVDVNNKDSINNIAMKLLRHGNYFKDCRGFILTNGVVVYTESEHNEICRIPNINNKFDFIRMGNIRVLPQSIDIGDRPTSEQRDVLRRAIACYADEELYLDIYQGKSSIGAHYIHPDWRYVMGEIDRFYSEGIKPQGNEYYESKNSKKQIVENKYDDLFNKANYDLQYFLKQGKEKYGFDGWYISSWMEKTHPEISVDPKDIKIYTALSDRLHKITKLWTDEDNKEESEKDLEQPKEIYDIISLAIEEFGLTSRLSQAGYILPDGKLLNFGSDGERETDHRQIAAVYKQNGIKIWNDEYRYNYVVDFMNHGAIRCDVNSGILDMTKEPTNEQFYAIKDFVRKAVDVDIDFTDDKGNTLHSVSYSDARPQAVVADIRRYYEDGIKPMGNVQYENKNMNNSHLIIESQESKSIAAAKRLVMQRLNYNEQEADEFIRIKLRNDLPVLRTPQGGKFILGVTRMFCDGELRTANDIGNLNSTLKLVVSDAHINEYDRNLNGMSCQELVQRFAKAMSDNLEAEKTEIGQMTLNAPSDYEIVRIDSFEQASQYGRYTSWCVTHQKNMFDNYTSNGINQFYFCLKNGFENIEEVPSEGCPLDEYGLSMIAVSVNENGMLNTCTCRWNHDNGGDDSIMNAKEVSQVIGMNFFEVFKPNNRWKDLLASVTQRLANGEDPRDVFGNIGDFNDGFAMVELNGKCNFINQEGRFLSNQWFDAVYDFKDGFADVELNYKWNYINQEGKFLSNQWFDFAEDFNDGFAMVKLNGKWNFINQEGRFLSDQWFDNTCDFSEGFGLVKLNWKWNFINQEGRFLSDQWFDYVDYFREGFARVRLNDKYNYINQEGRLLSDQWFSDAYNFSEGFARVRLNGDIYNLDTRGNLSLIESKNKNKKILIHENQLEAIKENLDFEVDSSEIDLSSFKKKHELVPNIWNPDGTLNSRVRLKLLDIADDFWKYVNLTWVEPSGIILTGSICNFNWSQYSDIDLHLIVDFDEIDEKTEFVRDYLDAKKNEWNNEHSGLQIMGYQVELYVQNLGEMPESNGIYDLEENDWIKEPNPDDIKSIGLNKFSIKDKAAKIMTIIDDMYDALASTDDSHQIEEMGDDASYLWKKVKNMRKNSLEKNGESGSGNIVYKILRRTGYLDRLFKLSNVVYDKSNSITESVESNNNVDVFALAKERFGVTNDIRECGYILPDGSMLDFSGRHMVTGNTDTSHLRGRRGVDHRGIGDLNWDADMTTKSGLNINMTDFIRMGAIRIHCSNTWSSINLFKKPTREQVNPMLRLIQYSKGNVTVEIGDGDNSYEYAEWDEANSRRVVNDIIRYFDGETINLVGNVTESKVYDKSNSITESKSKKKKYTVYIDGEKDDTFSDMNWKRKPKVGKGFYYGGAVFKIKKVTDDSIYAIEESKNTSTQLLNEWDKIDYFEKAKQYFGTTNDLNECGFILPNGEMLDLSSVKGRRGIPHRNVEAIGVGLETFIEHGAIRCDSRYKLINICKKPTKEQINRLAQIIKANDGSVSLDLGNGHVTFDYVDYKNANYKRIINDIINFFENKIKPSSLYESKKIIKEYLEKDNNLPLYKYFKWASTASSCEKARDLAYSCSYYIGKYIRKIYYRYSEFENLLNDGEFDYEDESLIEMFCNMLEENNLCDHFVSEMQSIVDYYELPSWCTMDFNRVVKNEWCIHFGSDSENIAREGFTGGTPEIEHLAYTNAGAQKSSAGYDFAFLINDRSVDYNEYGDEAVIFRTSGVEIYHYGDNQNQVVFWGPNVKSFIPIHQDNGDWVVYGKNGQVLVRCGRPSEIALWATENLPQYRKQIMTGKNGYTPMMSRWNSETNKVERKPYPIYRNESIQKYITLLKENMINEEWVGDGNSEHNPYKKRWDAERKALKDFLSNYGKLMQSRENGKLYKCYYDRTLSQLIGYNYCICIQWDNINMKPKSVLYIRALDKFTPNIKQVSFDTRGHDNVRGSYDDLYYQQ